MPWKNGGGVTTEIAVSPAGAGLEDFDWRVSMADVAADGPFSRFAGVDRTLAVLEGYGMTLAIDGRPAIALTSDDPPMAFPADVATHATLTRGPIVDLNVMTRRNSVAHRVASVTSDTDAACDDGDTVLIFCARGGARVVSGASMQLGRHDALLLQETARVVVTTEPAQLYIVTLSKIS